MASKLSLHCSDHCVGRGVCVEGVKFNIVTVMVDHNEVVVSIQIGRDRHLFLTTVCLVLCETSSVLVVAR